MAELKEYALTTLADVKESLGIPSSSSQYNNLIIRKINQATAMIESYCGRRFKKTTYTNEEYDATETTQLSLRQRPVVIDDDNTFTLKVRDTSLNEADYETLDSELYFVDKAAGVIDANFTFIGRWNRYVVTYAAGYDTIPDDLAEACASLACYFINNASAGAVNTTVKQEGQRRIQYGQGLKSTDDLFNQLGIKHVIDSYADIPLLADK